MIIIPQGNSLDGLIKGNHIKGQAYASSWNMLEDRINNPINPESTDRWCSYPTGEYDPEVWGVVFDHMIYITNYTLSSLLNPVFVSWMLEGYSSSHNWETISIVNDWKPNSELIETFNVTKSGPFNHFRFTSLHNGYDRFHDQYHFCIYKAEFFGAAFIIPKSTIMKTMIHFELKFLFILLI